MRSLLIVAVCSFASGCSVPVGNAGTTTTPNSTDQTAYQACDEDSSNEAYGCNEGETCPNMLNDVRDMTGFRVIGTASDRGGGVFVHVVDTCQHYFCGVDEDCLRKGGAVLKCMRPTGCLLVSKLKK